MHRRACIFMLFVINFLLTLDQQLNAEPILVVKGELTVPYLNQLKFLWFSFADHTVFYSAFIITGILLILMVVILIRHQRIRQANEQLKAKNEEIKQKNKILKDLHQRLKVQNTRITNQQQQLEEMNTVKDKIFSIIAHDFRSPLNTIQGVLNLLHIDVLSPEELKKMLPQLSHKVNSSISLLDNLLNWARTQMNGLKVKKIYFSLRPEVEETIGLISQTANQKDITVESAIDPESQVFADPDMIQLVVRNLLSNAIKFTKPGGLVRISAHQHENSVMVEVSDTGIGMSESTIQQLFQQAGFTTKGTDQEKGTGLGLVLCDEFIRRNGGKIWVESKKGKGTIFYFTLPSAAKIETPVFQQ